MSNKLRPRKEMTDQEWAFVSGVADGLTPPEAARRAGYNDLEYNVAKLMRQENIRSACFRALRKNLKTQTVQWRELIEEAKRIFALSMELGDPKLALAGASKVMDTVVKIGEKSIIEKVNKEDLETSRDELATAVMRDAALPPGDVNTPTPVLMENIPNREH